MSIGLGPAVYFEIINGKIICNGIMGTAMKASFSLGKPPSISFKLVTASHAENPICKMEQSSKCNEIYAMNYNCKLIVFNLCS